MEIHNAGGVRLQFAAVACISLLVSFYEANERGTSEIKVRPCYIASYPALTENSLLFGRDVDKNMRMCVDSRLFV